MNESRSSVNGSHPDSDRRPHDNRDLVGRRKVSPISRLRRSFRDVTCRTVCPFARKKKRDSSTATVDRADFSPNVVRTREMTGIYYVRNDRFADGKRKIFFPRRSVKNTRKRPVAVPLPRPTDEIFSRDRTIVVTAVIVVAVQTGDSRSSPPC